MILLKADAHPRQPVDIRSVHIAAAVAAELRPQIVGHHEENILPWCGLG